MSHSIQPAYPLDERFFLNKSEDLKPALNFEGKELYTSEYLKDLYERSILDSKYGKVIYNEIKELLDRDIIVPVWVEKSFLKRTFIKIFGIADPIHSIGAFYSKEDNKIYIFVDNNINVFSWALDDKFVSLTIHEGVHLVSGNKPQRFFSLFKNEFMEFYKNFFYDFFNIPKNLKVDLKRIVEYTYSLERSYLRSFNPKEYKKILTNTFLKNFEKDSDEYKKTLFKINKITFMIYRVTRDQLFVAKNAFLFLDIKKNLMNSYKKTFGMKPPKDVLFYQECFYPSEIISILSEMKITPKIIRAFKLL